MKKHTCKTCGKTFEYCRGCLLSPIPHKEAGYCSKTCQEASKIEKVIPVEDVEVVIVEEDISTSEKEVAVSSFFSATEEVVNIDEDIQIQETVIENKHSNTTPYYYNKKKKKNKYKENNANDNK